MRILYGEAEIATRVDALAGEIRDRLGDDFVLVPILTGGFMFAADLARALTRAGADPAIDFLQIASYGEAKVSSGVVKLIKDLTGDVAGREVLLVDDVLDSGRSLFFASKLMAERGAAACHICVAVDKQTGRAEDIAADWAAFTAGPDDFLVGYGMDDAGGRRGLGSICAL